MGDNIIKLLNSKKVKGFTLIELIVVMLILAILSAMFIPSMLGYIDKAGESSAMVETRSVVQAVQTLASESYVKNKGAVIKIGNGNSDSNITYVSQEEIFALAEVGGSASVKDVIFEDKVKLATLTYIDSTGSYQIVYTSGGGYDVISLTE